MRESSRARRLAASPSKVSPSRSASSGVMPVAAARSSAQRDCASRPSRISGSSSWHSAWYERHAIGLSGSAPAISFGRSVNEPTARGHCCWMPWLGASTSARLPTRRISSTPSSVLPLPGGATMCVRVLPC